MENPSHSNGAISLHLYCPPFNACSVFNKTTGKRTNCQVIFWSKFGEKRDKVCYSYLTYHHHSLLSLKKLYGYNLKFINLKFLRNWKTHQATGTQHMIFIGFSYTMWQCYRVISTMWIIIH